MYVCMHLASYDCYAAHKNSLIFSGKKAKNVQSIKRKSLLLNSVYCSGHSI